MRKLLVFALMAALIALAWMTEPASGLVPAEQLSSAQRRNHIALLKAIVASDVEATKKAIADGADPNLNVDDRLPLEAAIITGEIEVVRVLLDAGADPKAKNQAGKTMYEAAYALGDDPGDVHKEIGDLVKARAEGKADPAPVTPDPEDEKPQVILMPEQAVKCEPVAQPDLSAYKNPSVPEGWSAMTTNGGKIVILSNGKSGEDAGRLIYLEPERRPSDDLDDIMEWTEHNARSYAKMVGVNKPDAVEVKVSLTRVVPHKPGERKPVRIVAEFTIWDYPYIVGSFDMTGVIDNAGEFKGIVCYRGKTDAAMKAHSAYLSAVSTAFDADD